MKEAILNFAYILEKNPKIFVGVIVGIVGCIVLLIAEAVHVQTMVDALVVKDPKVIQSLVESLTLKYRLSRYVLLVVAVIWTVYQYKVAKKAFSRT